MHWYCLCRSRSEWPVKPAFLRKRFSLRSSSFSHLSFSSSFMLPYSAFVSGLVWHSMLNSPPPLREVHHIGDAGFGYAILCGNAFVSASILFMEADDLLFEFGRVVLWHNRYLFLCDFYYILLPPCTLRVATPVTTLI